MKESMDVYDHNLRDMESDYHSFFLAFPVSIIFHLIVAAALIFGQDFLPDKKISLPPVINVSMVPFPLQKSVPEIGQNDFKAENKAQPKEEDQVTVPEKPEKPKEPEKTKEKEKKAEPEKPKEKEKVVVPEKPKEKKTEPEKPKEKEKKAEKPKEKEKKAEPEKIRDKKAEPENQPAKKQIKHKKPDQRVAKSKEQGKKAYKNAIEQLKRKYKDELDENGPQGMRISGNGDPDAIIGRRDYGAIRFYRDNVIPDRVNKNWAFSEHLTTRRFNLEAVLVIRIMPDGEISDIRFKKRSGDKYFDDSAYKAVMKSNPLPQLPKGYEYYQVGLKFTPSGMN